jgi:DNA-binding response OmpR family regulator
MDETVVIVLVVEDDAAMQALAEDALSEAGFKVEAASSGEQAIQLLDAPDAAYRALITDVNLAPKKLTGWDVARHAREVFSSIPVIYVTGHSAEEWTARGVPNSVLLAEPFVPAQLITAVSQLLNASIPATEEQAPRP